MKKIYQIMIIGLSFSVMFMANASDGKNKTKAKKSGWQRTVGLSRDNFWVDKEPAWYTKINRRYLLVVTLGTAMSVYGLALYGGYVQFPKELFGVGKNVKSTDRTVVSRVGKEPVIKESAAVNPNKAVVSINKASKITDNHGVKAADPKTFEQRAAEPKVSVVKSVNKAHVMPNNDSKVPAKKPETLVTRDASQSSGDISINSERKNHSDQRGDSENLVLDPKNPEKDQAYEQSDETMEENISDHGEDNSAWSPWTQSSAAVGVFGLMLLVQYCLVKQFD
jgi:hypothetical protein